MRPDGTALCSLALVVVFLPVAAACLSPVALLVQRAFGTPPWVPYGLWLASAFGYGLRPVQLAMARLLWPIRQPTAAERQRLERIWRHVTAHADVRGRRFRIRVVDLPEANAHSVGRDLVCVTTGALEQLGDRELAGVLAHELGHHLRMHTSVSAYLVWVLLPLQGIALLGTLLAAPAAALGRSLSQRHSLSQGHSLGGVRGSGEALGASDGDYGSTWASACARGASRLGHGIRALFAAPGVAAFAVKNAAGRSAEFRVDAFAVEIGLGSELLSALRWFAACETTRGAAEYAGNGRARHAAVRIPRPTHPPLDRRIARIAARVAPPRV